MGYMLSGLLGCLIYVLGSLIVDYSSISTDQQAIEVLANPVTEYKSHLDQSAMPLRPSMASLPYLVVVGGSYVGVNTAQQLATAFADRFRVLLVEKNSHFQHLFAFPRFAVVAGVDTHKAFIPFTPGAFAKCPPGSGSVVQASAIALTKSLIKLDRKVTLDGQQVDSVPYEYLVVATGTKLTAPSTLPGSEKLDGTHYLQKHAQKVIRSKNIAVIGGGAVGVQTATDIKELYPEKNVTLIHSRDQLMPRFRPQLSDIIKERFTELGVNTKLGSRVKVPAEGYPTDGSTFHIELQDGTSVEADFAIIATGQDPQSGLIKALSPNTVNERGFIKMKKTLQIDDAEYPNIFAVGDIAETGANKAARPGGAQAGLVVRNVQHLLNREPLETYDKIDPPAIHLTLGITKNLVFANPDVGETEPYIWHRTDGRLDMGIDDVWTRRGGGSDFHL